MSEQLELNDFFAHLPFLNACEEILAGDIFSIFTLYLNSILNVLKIKIHKTYKK